MRRSTLDARRWPPGRSERPHSPAPPGRNRTASRRLERTACPGSPQAKPGSNPNCLCKLIPEPGGTRKAGLWAKKPGALAELGPDPATLKREVGRAVTAA